MEMSRVRLEGLLAAFPKLVGTGKQHTFVETGNVRYVFQSIEVSLIIFSSILMLLGIVSSIAHKQGQQYCRRSRNSATFIESDSRIRFSNR